MMPRLRRWHRVAISALALAVLLIFIPARALVGAMAQVPVATLAWTLGVFMLGHVGAALKWRLLQGSAGLPILATVRAHFSGVLANFWLPGVVGGDLVRVGVVFRQSSRPASVALASLVDRVVDSAALLLLALVGLIAIRGPVHDARRAFLAVLATGTLGLFGLVGAYWLLKRRAAGHARLVQLHDAVDLLARRPVVVLGAFAMSAAIQTAFILVNQQLGRAVGVHASTAVWFMAWPLSKLVALVPISAAGIGIREAAIVMLMRPFNASPEAVMASSLLWQALLFTGGLIGWSLLSFASSLPVVGREALQPSRE